MRSGARFYADTHPTPASQLHKLEGPLYDINGDGRLEIDSFKALFPNPEPYYAAPNGVVLLVGSFPDDSIVRSVVVKVSVDFSSPTNFPSGANPNPSRDTPGYRHAGSECNLNPVLTR